MSSFNNIVKINYKENQSEAVSLQEYILFENTKDSLKYLVFKFSNNLNQALHHIKYEISEFDSDGDLIEKAVVEYDNFNTLPGATFVPNAKLKVSFDCKTIKAKLLYAEFDRVAWKNGEYQNVLYSLNDFRRDYGNDPKAKKLSEKEEKKQARKQEKAIKETRKHEEKLQKALNKKRHFISKEFIHSNNTRAPRVCLTLLVLAFVIYLGVSIFYFNKNNLQFYENGFQYEVSSDGATIVDYDGGANEVIIPLKAGEYDVISIGKEAFKDDDVEVLRLEGKVAIMDLAFKNCRNLTTIINSNLITRVGDYAFENCESLKRIDLAGATYVGRGAFLGCKNIEYAKAPAAKILKDAFMGCDSIMEVEIRETDSDSKAMDIFGTKLPISLRRYQIGSRSFKKGFFDGMSRVNVEMINEDEATFEYGALEGLGLTNDYYKNESLEVYKGHIISVNPNSDYLHIPSYMSYLKEDLLKISQTGFLSSFKRVRIDEQNDPIDLEIMSQFTYLKELDLFDNTEFTYDAFDSNLQLDTLILNTNSTYYNLPSLNYLSKLVIEGDGYLSSNTINLIPGASRIMSLEIDEANGFDYSAFSSLSFLESITLPMVNYTLADLGISKTVLEVKLKNSDLTETPYGFIDGYYNLITLKLPTNINYIADGFINNSYISRIDIPSSVKSIGSNFISSCSNIYDLTIPEGVKSIGSYLINNCYGLNSLKLPKSLRSIGSYIINNASISYLEIPGNVTNIEAPLLGYGSGITALTTPFIGYNKDNAIAYSQFNLDYQNTMNLEVTGSVYGKYDTFSGCTSLRTLKVNDFSYMDKGLFSGLSLESLSFKGKTGSLTLSDLFNNQNVYLYKLTIEPDALCDRFFTGATISSLAVIGKCELNVDLFAGVFKINSLFISKDSKKNVIDYKDLALHVDRVYTDGRLDSDVRSILIDNNVSVYEAFSLEDFLDRY